MCVANQWDNYNHISAGGREQPSREQLGINRSMCESKELGQTRHTENELRVKDAGATEW